MFPLCYGQDTVGKMEEEKLTEGDKKDVEWCGERGSGGSEAISVTKGRL